MVDQIRGNNIQSSPQTQRSSENSLEKNQRNTESYFSSDTLINETFLGKGLGELSKTLTDLPLSELSSKDFSKPEFKQKIEQALDYVSSDGFLNDLTAIMTEIQKALKTDKGSTEQTITTSDTQGETETTSSGGGFSALFEMLRLIAENNASRREFSQEQMWSERDSTKSLQDKSLKKQDQANDMRMAMGYTGAGMQLAEAGVQAGGSYRAGQVGNSTGTPTTGDTPQVTQTTLSERQLQQQQAKVDGQTKTQSATASGVAGIANTAMERKASDTELEASKMDKRAELESMSREDMLKWAQDIQSQLQSMLSTIQSILSQLVGLIGKISGGI